ncbi:T9SS type A sorting domain-containing protein [Winogradskyella thalassocola]|uniref:Por secretion system C-terminal sorting domain-containing protein n=1 Tax=Winogradskyella thalassocola TaxID=262004 RepID=A0A1G7YNC4_9FLAO|nr:T9SS type A sorting domain-containing protein [Winogradskyella thalassocola]SDG98048.1 Por secretion system C-terminal sorting domain-containing protein [Winogradskyella thalassocola]
MKKITFILVLISYVSFAQDYTYIDFGINTQETVGNWNNISILNAADAVGLTTNLIDSNGASTGVSLTIDDAFDTVNTAGNTSPDPSLPFPDTAARDSFFGETSTFSGSLEPTGGFILTGLDPSKYYAFSIFASRNGVSDNREAQYTVVGSTTEIVTLNSSNNTTETADVLNIQSNSSGEITLTAEPGPNNTNGSGFYYLGAIEMITSDTSLSTSDFKLEQMLSVYPNPVADILELNINLEEKSKLNIEIFDINGKSVAALFNGEQDAGNFQFNWERSLSKSQISTGMYFLKINVNNREQTKKIFFK